MENRNEQIKRILARGLALCKTPEATAKLQTLALDALTTAPTQDADATARALHATSAQGITVSGKGKGYTVNYNAGAGLPKCEAYIPLGMGAEGFKISARALRHLADQLENYVPTIIERDLDSALYALEAEAERLAK